jgi:hypothetical protein
VTVPYDPSFSRSDAHWSWLYFGASLPAFHRLLVGRGYRLVGSNTTGNDAFFVRDDVAGSLPGLSAAEAWVESRFRESRGPEGKLTLLDSHASRRGVMAEMPLVDTATGEVISVGDLDGPA